LAIVGRVSGAKARRYVPAQHDRLLSTKLPPNLNFSS